MSDTSTTCNISESLKKAEQLIQQNQLEDAITELNTINSQDLSSADAVNLNHYYGVALSKQNKISEALLKFKKESDLAVSANDQSANARALESIGSLLHQEGRLQDAYNYYEKALKIREHLEDKDGQGRGHRNLGNVYIDMNKPNEALKEFDKSKEFFKELGQTEDMAPAIIHKATLLYQKKGLDAAVESYKEGIEEDKCTHYLVLNNYAFLLILKGQIEESVSWLNRALEDITAKNINDDDLALIYLNLGISNALLKNLADGEKYLRKAAELLKDYPDARAVELLLQANDKYRDQDFHQYLIVDNGQKHSLAHLNLATILAWNGKIEEAKKELEMGIDLDRAASYPYLSAGWIYLLDNDEKAAGSAFKRACGSEPNNEEFRKALKLVNPYFDHKVGRNDPCPCGSGKKFKKCHGSF